MMQIGKDFNIIHQRTNVRRHMQPQRLMADVDEHRPATATDDTRTLSARRATHTPHKQARHMRMLCADKATEPPRMRPRGWPTRHFVNSVQHGRNESGRAEGMHGQRSGTPAGGRCRRRSSPRTHAGVLQTPCSRADHLVAHRAASGEIMPAQSCRSGPSSSKHTKHGGSHGLAPPITEPVISCDLAQK